MNHLVFVYGTLKKGQPNHHLLTNAKFMGERRLGGNWAMYNLGAYPTITPSTERNAPIIGELYEIDDETFKRLDWLEGYPHLYNRERVDVFDRHGEMTIGVWVYYMGIEPMFANQIPAGVW